MARAVAELSDLFLGLTQWRGAYAGSATLRRAYLHYYLPVNLPKVRVPLGEWLRADPGRLASAPLHCLDLGSGPGTALMGLLDFLRSLPAERRPTAVRAVALDQSFESLKDAAALIERVARLIPGLPVSFEPLRMDLMKDRSELFPLAASEGRFDLVIAANVLCEVAREAPDGWERAAGLTEAIARELLSSQGAMVMVEPGSRKRPAISIACATTGSPLPCNKSRRRASIGLCGARHGKGFGASRSCPGMLLMRVAVDRRMGFARAPKSSYLVLNTTAAVHGRRPRRGWLAMFSSRGRRRVYLCAEGAGSCWSTRACWTVGGAARRLRRETSSRSWPRTQGRRLSLRAGFLGDEPPPSAAFDVVRPATRHRT